MHASDPEVVYSSGSGSSNGANGSHPEPEAAQLDLGFAQRAAGSGVLDTQDVVLPTTITKRDGRVVPFDPNRIERALSRCFAALGREPYTPIPELALRVVNIMSARRDQPSVERVQDAVELTLQAAGEFEAAKAYILYRAEHAKQRQDRPIPDEVRAAFAEADQYFPTPLQKFQFFDKYSRFDYDQGRRETWIETVDRSVNYLHDLVRQNTGVDLGGAFYERIRRFILEMKSMPSMRLLAMAGAPAHRDNTAIYNCSYQPVESVDSFAEALLISMAGCGVGFSVERQYVENFPRVQRQRRLDPLRHTIEDSAQGWAEALRQGMYAWFDGRDVQFDYSEIRPAGTPLRTKGGRASGPGPLLTMLEFTRGRLLARQGMHLRPLDAHDIMCMVGNAAVSGGVRRCLPAGTRVHTSRGAIPIEEVAEGDLVMTASGYKPVTGWVDQGVQDVVEIVTESGTIFRCTPHHRVAVLTDVWGGHRFKFAADLTPDDRLLFISRPIDGQAQPLASLPPKRAADHSGSVVRQPVLDEETAWFLGKFFADGYAQVGVHDAAGKRGNTQFSVSCNLEETEQIDRVAAWMEDHGLVVQRLLGKGQWLTLRSSNRQIARWMQRYKRPNMALRVPECIWRATPEIRAAFLAGLMDGDGCFTDRPVTVVATVYESFAREIVKLLATLGVIAEVRQRRPANELGWQAQWVVSIKDALALQRAEDTLGAKACSSWVPRQGKQAGYTVPGWMVRRDVPRDRWADVWPASRDANMNSTTLTALVDATHFVPVAVREVRAGGPAHTYDIEVRDGSMFVAEGYLVHNTAMISLFDYDDLEMRLCKSGDFEHDNSQRWNANNSAVWPERGLDQIEVVEQVLDMVKSQRGEPGIFNRKAAFDLSPLRRQQLGYLDFGTNPCVTGETWVLTTRGPQRVRDLVGRLHSTFVNGRAHATTDEGFWRTGSRPVLKLRTREGYELRLTANHRVLAVTHQSSKVQRSTWREAGSLRPGDRVLLHCHRGAEWAGNGTFDEGWLLGSLVGDATFSAGRGQQGQVLTMAHLDDRGDTRAVVAASARAHLQAAVPTRADCVDKSAERWNTLRLPSAGLAELASRYGIERGANQVSEDVERTSSAFHRGFLRGLFDADGSVQETPARGVSIRLSQSNLESLRAAQRMLLRLGIVSTISAERRPSGYRQLPPSQGGSATSWCQADHELIITADNVRQYADTIGFSDPEKAERLDAMLGGYRRQLNRDCFTATVQTIEPDGIEDVYDCAVPGPNAFDANGLVAHNCGEINLRKWQFCVAGDTLLITREGVIGIQDAVGKPIEVWNGKRWARVTPFQTGENQQLYRVHFRDGSYLDCTGDHRFSVTSSDTAFGQAGLQVKTTRELMGSLHRRWATEPFRIEHDGGHLVPEEDAYALGAAVGNADLVDVKNPRLPLRSTHYAPWPVLEEAVSPARVAALKSEPAALHELFGWSRQAILAFLAGWIDAEGSETSGGGVRLYVSDFERARRVQLLLTRCGLRSAVTLLDRAGTATNLGLRRHDVWYVEITECADLACRRVDTSHGKAALPSAREQVIASIEPLPGLHDTFCFTEPDEHKGVFGNTLTYQCNLSISVARQEDTFETLREKVEVATIIGTIQSLATHFPDLRPMWKQNSEEERLLGVDINGQLDSPVAQDASVMRQLRETVIETNRQLAATLGINQSSSTTCVKPSGNSSQLLNCSSGLHARWAPYYERNVRVAATSPVFKVLRDAGVPMDPENGQTSEGANTWVIHFPVKAPDGAITRKDRSAIEQCEYWLRNKVNWTEHNPSVTILYRQDEIIDLTKWIWENRDYIGGMAFLPTFDAHYAQLPYIEISKEEYEQRAASFPEIDFSKIFRYESTDLTNAAQELACMAGQCELE